MSSVGPERKGAHPFVPYRIDESNLHKIESLFQANSMIRGLPADLPNSVFLSRYGFTDRITEENGELDDDSSMNSTLSSNSGSRSLDYSASDHSHMDSVSSRRQREKQRPITMSTAHRKFNSATTTGIAVMGRQGPHSSYGNHKQLSHSISAPSGLYESSGSQSKFAQMHHLDSVRHYRQRDQTAQRQTASHFKIGPPSEASDDMHEFYGDSLTSLSKMDNSHRNNFDSSISVGSGASNKSSRSRVNPLARASTASSALNAGKNSFEFPLAGSPSKHYKPLSAHPSAHPFASPVPKGRDGRDIGVRLMSPDITGFLAELDPLSQNINAGVKSREFETMSISSDLDRFEEEEFDEDDLLGELMDESGELSALDRDILERKLSTTELMKSAYDNNTFVQKKRMRIRAEKLVDHQFTKRLFNNKATTEDAQSLVNRMEGVLQLLDKNRTGFVTWEEFARVALSLAPPKLLRGDVTAFMDAQTDDSENLVDYREFIISGKVMVINKQDDPAKLPIQGWLKRQKLVVGEESTYSWKNHVKWYQVRKASAVVWLMRRAARSMAQSIRLQEAEDYLRKVAVRARAQTWLMEAGWLALEALENRYKSKRNLLKRSVHARRWVIEVDRAQVWLATQAKAVIQQILYEEELSKIRGNMKLQGEEKKQEKPRPTQANYATLFKMNELRKIAIKEMREKV